ncbi:TPM domain-containing protein [Microbacterium sp. P03]|uniref:TPM domain-containing protein n=1 Tax=Microbacterium sp. P03 TaxID=3366946 RepID=UPI0037466E4B
MRARWAVGLVAALSMVFGGAAMSAFATAPPSLGAGYVLDDVNVLSSSDAAAAQTRLEQLKADTGLDLWVVYVDTFTSPSDAAGWANQVATDNGLGPTQYLLAIATESRQFYLSGDSAGPVDEEALGAIEQQRVQPALQSGSWLGAVDAAADGLTDAASGGSGGAAGDAGGGALTAVLVAVFVVVVIILVIVLVTRSRRKKAGAGAPGAAISPPVDLEELGRQASSALVATDDAVKTSEQELGFARAQFGDAATGEFEQAIASAKTDLNQAFTLKQQLDDGQEDTPEESRAWNEQIIALCARANDGLDDKAAAFDELRKLEQNAPEAYARVQAERDTVASAIDGARALLAQLGGAYTPNALSTVADNPAQAADRVAFADERLTAAQAAIGAGNGGEAAVEIRAAEEAISQARLLEDAVAKMQNDLAGQESGAEALLTELESDIATASALPDPQGALAPVIASTRQRVDAGRAALAGPVKDPLAVLKSLEAANAQIDGVVQGARDAAAQADRTRQMLGQSILQAQAQVSAAEDYITARRGAVGAEARTRLAEAGSSLVQAQQLQSSAPDQALQQAQRANQLAGQAIQYAQNDVGAFSGGGSMLGGGSTGGGGGNGMLGAVLGGIVINSLLGGGGGRSSGGMGGIFGGGGGGRSSGGGMSPGSFGGGGTRSRRGGGRF